MMFVVLHGFDTGKKQVTFCKEIRDSKDNSRQIQRLKLVSESKFLNTKFELGGSFGMSLEGDCHEVEVTLLI
jgi:hypothetical protein